VAAFSLSVKRSAAREIERVEPVTQRRRIVARIRALESDPRPAGAEKLAGTEACYRVRQGPWRILFEVDDARRTVVIFKVGHRREVYR